MLAGSQRKIKAGRGGNKSILIGFFLSRLAFRGEVAFFIFKFKQYKRKPFVVIMTEAEVMAEFDVDLYFQKKVNIKNNFDKNCIKTCL